MVILFLSCRNLPRPGNRAPVLNPRPRSNPLLFFYPMSKTCLNNFAAASTTTRRTRAVFKSETTLRSQIVRPKDAPGPAKQGVVYRIPCELDFGKVYIGETGRPMQDRIKVPVLGPPPFQSTLTVHSFLHIHFA